MSKNRTVKALAEFIRPIFGENYFYLSHIERPLDECQLTLLEIQLKNITDNCVAVASLVAKCIPLGYSKPMEQLMEQLFRTEIGFYTVFLPALQDFRKEKNLKELDCFRTYHSGRSCLNKTIQIFDQNALLIFENVQINGYNVVQSAEGLDLLQTLQVLKQLAKIHATTIALKEAKPEEFHQICNTPLVKKLDGLNLDALPKETLVRKTLGIATFDEMCLENIRNIKQFLELIFDKYESQTERHCTDNISDTFATIIHANLSSNQIWIKTDEYLTTTVKFADFQYCQVGSLAKDVVFFLLTTVDIKVLETCYDSLIQFYYTEFVKTLIKLNYVNLDLFNCNGFFQEFQEVAAGTVIVRVISETLKVINKTTDDNLSFKQTDRIVFIVREYMKRGYIKVN